MLRSSKFLSRREIPFPSGRSAKGLRGKGRGETREGLNRADLEKKHGRNGQEELEEEEEKKAKEETRRNGIQEYSVRLNRGRHTRTTGYDEEQNETRIAAKKYRRSTEKIRILAVTTRMDERDRETAASQSDRKKSCRTKGEGWNGRVVR